MHSKEEDAYNNDEKVYQDRFLKVAELRSRRNFGNYAAPMRIIMYMKFIMQYLYIIISFTELLFQVVATMTATKGRYRRFSVVVATGNGQGLCGIGKARALTLSSAVRRAKSCASQNIISFELKEGRTCNKIFASPLPEGKSVTLYQAK
ncbi:unnamed protein product [Trichobilharzia regenti]|nr:unnamed protein product [Trichobilharzia regenti]